MHEHATVRHRQRERLDARILRIRPLHGHFVGAATRSGGPAYGASGGHVELPAVPGTTEDLALARPEIFAGAARGALWCLSQAALAEGRALMGAAIAEGIVGSVHIEHADRATVNLHDFARARRDLRRSPPDAPPSTQPVKLPSVAREDRLEQRRGELWERGSANRSPSADNRWRTSACVRRPSCRRLEQLAVVVGPFQRLGANADGRGGTRTDAASPTAPRAAALSTPRPAATSGRGTHAVPPSGGRP